MRAMNITYWLSQIQKAPLLALCIVLHACSADSTARPARSGPTHAVPTETSSTSPPSCEPTKTALLLPTQFRTVTKNGTEEAALRVAVDAQGSPSAVSFFEFDDSQLPAGKVCGWELHLSVQSVKLSNDPQDILVHSLLVAKIPPTWEEFKSAIEGSMPVASATIEDKTVKQTVAFKATGDPRKRRLILNSQVLGSESTYHGSTDVNLQPRLVIHYEPAFAAEARQWPQPRFDAQHRGGTPWKQSQQPSGVTLQKLFSPNAGYISDLAPVMHDDKLLVVTQQLKDQDQGHYLSLLSRAGTLLEGIKLGEQPKYTPLVDVAGPHQPVYMISENELTVIRLDEPEKSEAKPIGTLLK